VKAKIASPNNSLGGRLAPAAVAVLAGWAALFTLTAFPVYPPSWTIPIAVLLAGLAWRWPRAAAITGAVLAVPAFWNFAQAAGLAWIVLAGAWTWTSVRGGGRRCLAPLVAGPLALIGLGPAFVLVAATAPTPRRRAAEAAAGAVVAATCGGWAGLRPVRSLSGANSPLIYLRVCERNPQIATTAAAMVLFAVLLAIACAGGAALAGARPLGPGFWACSRGRPATAGPRRRRCRCRGCGGPHRYNPRRLGGRRIRPRTRHLTRTNARLGSPP